MYLLLLLLLLPSISSSSPQLKVYIVYLGASIETRSDAETAQHHYSLLLSIKNNDEAAARPSLLYSYRHTLDGFAALLSDQEALHLSAREEVISTFVSGGQLSLHTTRSWDFIAQEEGDGNGVRRSRLPVDGNGSDDLIVGMLDSGVWPESRSFADGELGPPPARWKGVCSAGDAFNSSSCNKKIIGARCYIKAYEAYYGGLNASYAYRSPRDHDGHGTHTASTVAGAAVPGASAIGGFAAGTATGGAPRSRLAVYKVCWPIPGPNPNIENTCFEADMLAAIDDAVGDGVDIISASIGSVGAPPRLANDGIAVGALHAARRGVVVVCSAGNSGPAAGTVSNLAPWMITVGASSIDRAFDATVTLDDGTVITGQTVTPYQLKNSKPLIYAGDAAVASTPANATGQCLPGSLDPAKVKNKIVLCFRGSGLRVAKGQEVKRAGGAGMILGNAAPNGDEVPVDAHVLPALAVSASAAQTILSYIKTSTACPTASLGRAATVVGVRPSPAMAQFSSRGPNPIEPSILKPDVTAPGLNILAAWSGASPPTKLDGDGRRVSYNIMSGTSMSCPHVSAAAVLVKSAHRHWSASAVQSAIMTTATTVDSEGRALMNGDGTAGGAIDFGAGHIRPALAVDPGLVYETSYADHLLFMCAGDDRVQMDPAFPCPANPPPQGELNYPSVAIAGLVNGTVTVRRTVTNVGRGEAVYTVTVTEPPPGAAVKMSVSPKRLRFTKAGERRSFRVTVTVTATATGRRFVSGAYTWSDGTHVVRSPIFVSL